MLRNIIVNFIPLLSSVEFEASIHSEEDLGAMLDEDEWTDRNFGNSVLNNHKSKSKVASGASGGGAGAESSTKASENGEDTSEDSISDIDTDSYDEDDENLDLGPTSRPLTADETRQLQKEWIKKYDPGSDSEEESKYDNVRRQR